MDSGGLNIAVLHECVVVHYGVDAILNKKYECEVRGYVNPSVALSYVRSGTCNLIFVQVPEFTSHAADFSGLVPTICLSDSTKVDTLQDAISLGASGYLLMTDEPNEYCMAVEMAQSFGKLRARAPEIKELICKIEEKRRVITETLSELTSRDLDVLELIAQGYDNKTIASELNVTYGTARNRVSSILGKTDMPNRTALALWAVENEIVDTDDTS